MKSENIKFEVSNIISSSDINHTIDVYLHLNKNSEVLTTTPLEMVKEFIEVINVALEQSKNSNVIIGAECVLADVYTAAYNYCELFNNINLHYIMDEKEVDSEEVFKALNLGYDYIIDYIEDLTNKNTNENT